MERATVIASEEEYRIAKSEAKKFERSLASARGSDPSPDVHPRIHNAMIEGLESELDFLREQLDHYEALKAGRVKTREIRSLGDHDEIRRQP